MGRTVKHERTNHRTNRKVRRQVLAKQERRQERDGHQMKRFVDLNDMQAV